MSLAVWFSLVTACIVISLTPGAGAINTMSNAMSQGWRRSIWGIIGQQLALVVHVAIVAAGVGLLVSRSEILFTSDTPARPTSSTSACAFSCRSPRGWKETTSRPPTRERATGR